MMWKAIGQSVIGTSHVAADRPCEDAVQYDVLKDAAGDNVLVCCVSDGAGSARYAAWASDYATARVLELTAALLEDGEELAESHIYEMAEDIYSGLEAEAEAQGVELNEYSCTLLGCIIYPHRAAFFQVGDGAIVRNDGSDFYTTIWWPENGEYQNTTSFVIDDRTFSKLNVMIIEEPIYEVALFTDGLQLLALSMESNGVHQPFFNDLFRYLRMADNEENLAILNRKLGEYLNSTQINNRTDDDKTLFLATRPN